MKTSLLYFHQELPRPNHLCRRVLPVLILICLVATAQAAIYVNVNNASLSLNNTNDWKVGGVTPTTLPGSNDTIWFTGAGVTSSLGGSLSVNGIVVDNAVTGNPRSNGRRRAMMWAENRAFGRLEPEPTDFSRRPHRLPL
jgi:hypothetical protein